MHTTYGIDTCIETNEILAFGMEVYSRYIPGICKNLEYVRHISDICLTYDTIRIPDDCPSRFGEMDTKPVFKNTAGHVHIINREDKDF
jgi:hypothetical protein